MLKIGLVKNHLDRNDGMHFPPFDHISDREKPGWLTTDETLEFAGVTVDPMC